MSIEGQTIDRCCNSSDWCYVRSMLAVIVCWISAELPMRFSAATSSPSARARSLCSLILTNLILTPDRLEDDAPIHLRGVSVR